MMENSCHQTSEFSHFPILAPFSPETLEKRTKTLLFPDARELWAHNLLGNGNSVGKYTKRNTAVLLTKRVYSSTIIMVMKILETSCQRVSLSLPHVITSHGRNTNSRGTHHTVEAHTTQWVQCRYCSSIPLLNLCNPTASRKRSKALVGSPFVIRSANCFSVGM